MLKQYNDILINFKEQDLAKKIKRLESENNLVLDNNKIHFIRCDGRHFKSYCKGFKKPFDMIFRNAMRRTMISLCEEISGSFIGFTESDEITIGFQKLNEESELYFNGRKNKISSSIAASCTLFFNQYFKDEVDRAKVIRLAELANENQQVMVDKLKEQIEQEFATYTKKFNCATFDGRVFSMDRKECSEAIIWRMLDCNKNAIQMIARCNFPLKELHGKKTYEMKQMLEEKGVYLNSEDIRNLYGTICYKKEMTLYFGTERECIRKKFICDESYRVLDLYKILEGEAILHI